MHSIASSFQNGEARHATYSFLPPADKGLLFNILKKSNFCLIGTLILRFNVLVVKEFFSLLLVFIDLTILNYFITKRSMKSHRKEIDVIVIYILKAIFYLYSSG